MAPSSGSTSGLPDEDDDNNATSTVFYDGTYAAELSTYVIDNVSAAAQIVMSTDENHFAGIPPPTQTVDDVGEQLMLVYRNRPAATAVVDQFEWVPTQAAQVKFAKGWQILTSTQNGNFLYVDPPATTNTMSYLVYKQGGVGISWTDVVNDFPFVVDTKCQLLSYDAVKNAPTVTTGTMTNLVLQTTNSNTTGLTFGYIAPANMNINPLDIAQGYSLLTVNPDNTFGLSRNFGYSQDLQPGQIAYLEDNSGQYLLAGIEAPVAPDMLLTTYENTDTGRIRWRYMSFSGVSGIATPSEKDRLLVTQDVGDGKIGWSYQSFSSASGIPDAETANGFLVSSAGEWVIAGVSTATGVADPVHDGELLRANGLLWESVPRSSATGIPEPVRAGELLRANGSAWESVPRNAATGLPTTAVSGQLVVSDGANGWLAKDVPDVTRVPFPAKNGTLLVGEHTKSDSRWLETPLSTAIGIDDASSRNTGYLLTSKNNRWAATTLSEAIKIDTPASTNTGKLLVSNGYTWSATDIVTATHVSLPVDGAILQGVVNRDTNQWFARAVSTVTHVNLPSQAADVLVASVVDEILTGGDRASRYQWVAQPKRAVLDPFLETTDVADGDMLVGSQGRWVARSVSAATGLPTPNPDGELQVLVSQNDTWALSNMNDVTDIPLHPTMPFQLLGSNPDRSAWEIMDVAQATNIEFSDEDYLALMSYEGGWIAVERSILTGIPEADVEDNILYVGSSGGWVQGQSYLVTRLSLPDNIGTLPVAADGSWRETVVERALAPYIDIAASDSTIDSVPAGPGGDPHVNTESLLQSRGSRWEGVEIPRALSSYVTIAREGIPKPGEAAGDSAGSGGNELTVLQSRDSKWTATRLPAALSDYVSVAADTDTVSALAQDGLAVPSNTLALLQSRGSRWEAIQANLALSDYMSIAADARTAAAIGDGTPSNTLALLQSHGSRWEATTVSNATSIADAVDGYILFAALYDEGHEEGTAPTTTATGKLTWKAYDPAIVTGVPKPKQRLTVLQSDGKSWAETIVSTAISVDDAIDTGSAANPLAVLQSRNGRWTSTKLPAALSDYVSVAADAETVAALAQEGLTVASNTETLLQSRGSRWEAIALPTALSSYVTVADSAANQEYVLQSRDSTWRAMAINQALSSYVTVADSAANELTVLQSRGSKWTATKLPAALSDYVSVAADSDTAQALGVPSNTETLLQSRGSRWEAIALPAALSSYVTVADVASNDEYVLQSRDSTWRAMALPDALSSYVTVADSATNGLTVLQSHDGKWTATSVATAISVDDAVNTGSAANRLTVLQSREGRWTATKLPAALSDYVAVAADAETAAALAQEGLTVASNTETLLQSRGSRWEAVAINNALSSYITVAAAGNAAYFLKSAATGSDGTYGWQAQPFSTATGIPDPITDKLYVLATDTEGKSHGGWVLMDPYATTGLPDPSVGHLMIGADADESNPKTHWVTSAVSDITGVTWPTKRLTVLQSDGTSWAETIVSTAISVDDAIDVGETSNTLAVLQSRKGRWSATKLPAALSDYVTVAADAATAEALGVPSNTETLLQSRGSRWEAMAVNQALSSYVTVAANGSDGNELTLLQSRGSKWEATKLPAALSDYVSVAADSDTATALGVPSNTETLLQSRGSRWEAIKLPAALSSYVTVADTAANQEYVLQSRGSKWQATALPTALSSYVTVAAAANAAYFLKSAAVNGSYAWQAQPFSTATGIPDPVPDEHDQPLVLTATTEGWILMNPMSASGLPTEPPKPHQLLAADTESKWTATDVSTAVSIDDAVGGVLNVPQSNGSRWVSTAVNKALSDYVSVADSSSNNLALLQSRGSRWEATALPAALSDYVSVADSSSNTLALLQSRGSQWQATALPAALSDYVSVAAASGSASNPFALLQSHGSRWDATTVNQALAPYITDITAASAADVLLRGVRRADILAPEEVPPGAPEYFWQAQPISTATGLPDPIVLPEQVNYVVATNGSGWHLVDPTTTSGLPTANPNPNQLLAAKPKNPLDGSDSTQVWTAVDIDDAISLDYAIDVGETSNTLSVLQSREGRWTATKLPAALSDYVSVAAASGSASNPLALLQSRGSRWEATALPAALSDYVSVADSSSNNLALLQSRGSQWQATALPAALSDYVSVAAASGSASNPLALLQSRGSRWEATALPEALSSYVTVADVAANQEYVLQSRDSTWRAMALPDALSSYITVAAADNAAYFLKSAAVNGSYGWQAQPFSTATGIPDPEKGNYVLGTTASGAWALTDPTAASGLPTNTPGKGEILVAGLNPASASDPTAAAYIWTNRSISAAISVDDAVNTGSAANTLTVLQSREGRWTATKLPAALSDYVSVADSSSNNLALLQSRGSRWEATALPAALSDYVSVAAASGSASNPLTLLQSRGSRWEATALPVALESYLDTPAAPDTDIPGDDGDNGMLLQAVDGHWTKTAVNDALAAYITKAVAATDDDILTGDPFATSGTEGTLLQGVGSRWAAMAVPEALAAYVSVATGNEGKFLKAVSTASGVSMWQAQTFSAATGIPDPLTANLVLGTTEDGGWKLTDPTAASGLPTANPGMNTILASNNNPEEKLRAWAATAISTAISIDDAVNTGSAANTLSLLQSREGRWTATALPTALSSYVTVANSSANNLTLLQSREGKWTATALPAALSDYVTVADASSNDEYVLQSRGSQWKATALPAALSSYVSVAAAANAAYFLKSAAVNGSYAWQAQPFSTATGIPDPTANNSVLGVQDGKWTLTDPTAASGLPTAKPEKNTILASNNEDGEKASWQARQVNQALSSYITVADSAANTLSLLQSREGTWQATALPAALSDYVSVAAATGSASNPLALLQSRGSRWEATALPAALSSYVSVAAVGNANTFLQSREGGWVATTAADALANAGYIPRATDTTDGFLLRADGSVWTAVSASTATRVPDATTSDQRMVLFSNGAAPASSGEVTAWSKVDVSTAISVDYAAVSNTGYVLQSDGTKWAATTVPDATGLPDLATESNPGGKVLGVSNGGSEWTLMDLKSSSGLPSDSVVPNRIMASGSSSSWQVLDPATALSDYVSVANSSTNNLTLLQSREGKWQATALPAALSSYIADATAASNNTWLLQANSTTSRWEAVAADAALATAGFIPKGSAVAGKLLVGKYDSGVSSTSWVASAVSTVTGVPVSAASANTFLASAGAGGSWTESVATAALMSSYIDVPTSSAPLLVADESDARWVAKTIPDATGLPDFGVGNNGKVIAVASNGTSWTLVDLNDSTGIPADTPEEGQLMVGSGGAWAVQNPNLALAPYIADATTSGIDKKVLVADESAGRWVASTVSAALAPYVPVATGVTGQVLVASGDRWVASAVSTVTGVSVTAASANTFLASSGVGGSWTESVATAALMSSYIDVPTSSAPLLVADESDARWVAKTIPEATGLPAFGVGNNGKVVAVNSDGKSWTLVDLNASTGIPAGKPEEGQLMVGNGTSWQIAGPNVALAPYVADAADAAGKVLVAQGGSWVAATLADTLAAETYIPAASAVAGQVLVAGGDNKWHASAVSAVTGVPVTAASSHTFLVSSGAGSSWTESVATAALMASFMDAPTSSDKPLLMVDTVHQRWKAATVPEATGLPAFGDGNGGKVVAVNNDGKSWTLVDLNASTGIPAGLPGSGTLMVGVSYTDSITHEVLSKWEVRAVGNAVSTYISLANAANNGRLLQANSATSRWEAVAADTALAAAGFIPKGNAVEGKLLVGKYDAAQSTTSWVASAVSAVTGVPTSAASANTFVASSGAGGSWTESVVTTDLLEPVIDKPSTDGKLLVADQSEGRWVAKTVPEATGVPAFAASYANMVLAMNSAGEAWEMVDLNASTGIPSTAPHEKDLMVGNASSNGWSIAAPNTALAPYIADATGNTGKVLVAGSKQWQATTVPAALSSYIPVAGTSNAGHVLVSGGAGGDWKTSTVSAVTGVPVTAASANTLLVSSGQGQSWHEGVLSFDLVAPVFDKPTATGQLLAPTEGLSRWQAVAVSTATGLPDISAASAPNKVLGVNSQRQWVLVDPNASTGMPSSKPANGAIMVGRPKQPGGPSDDTYWSVELPAAALAPYVADASVASNNALLLQANSTTSRWEAVAADAALATAGFIPKGNAVDGKLLVGKYDSGASTTSWVASAVSAVTGVPVTAASANTLLVSGGAGNSWTESVVTTDLLAPVIAKPSTDGTLLVADQAAGKWAAKTVPEATGLPDLAAGSEEVKSGNVLGVVTGGSGGLTWGLINLNQSTGIPAGTPEARRIMATGAGTAWSSLTIPGALAPFIPAPATGDDHVVLFCETGSNGQNWSKVNIHTAAGIPAAGAGNAGQLMVSGGAGGSWVASAVSTVTGLPTSAASNNTLLVSSGAGGSWTESVVTRELLSPALPIPDAANRVLRSKALDGAYGWESAVSLDWTLVGLPAGEAKNDKQLLQFVYKDGSASWQLVSFTDSSGLPATGPTEHDVLFGVKGGGSDGETVTWGLTQLDAALTYYIDAPATGTLLAKEGSRWAATAVSAALSSYIPVAGAGVAGQVLVADSSGSWHASAVSAVTGVPTSAASSHTFLVSSGAGGSWTESVVTADLLEGVIGKATNAGQVLVSTGTDAWAATAVNAALSGYITVADSAANNLALLQSREGKWEATALPAALSSYIPVAGASNAGQVLVSGGAGGSWHTSAVSAVTGVPTSAASSNTFLVSSGVGGSWTESVVTADLLAPVLPKPAGTNQVLLSTAGTAWEAVGSLPAAVTGLPSVTAANNGCVLSVSGGKWAVVNPSSSGGESGSTGFLPTPSIANALLVSYYNSSNDAGWNITTAVSAVTGVPTSAASSNTFLVSSGVGGSWTESVVTADLLEPVLPKPGGTNKVLLSTTGSSWTAVDSLPPAVTGLPSPAGLKTPHVLITSDGEYADIWRTHAIANDIINPPHTEGQLLTVAHSIIGDTYNWRATDVFEATGLPNYTIGGDNANKVVAVNSNNDGYTLVDLNQQTGFPVMPPTNGDLMVGTTTGSNSTGFWSVKAPALALSPYIATANDAQNQGHLLVSSGGAWVAKSVSAATGVPDASTSSTAYSLLGSRNGAWSAVTLEEVIPGEDTNLLQYSSAASGWKAVTSLDWTLVGLPSVSSTTDANKYLQFTSTGWQVTAIDFRDESGLPQEAPAKNSIMASGDTTQWNAMTVPAALSSYIAVAGASNTGQVLVANGDKWTATTVSTALAPYIPVASAVAAGQVLVSSSNGSWVANMVSEVTGVTGTPVDLSNTPLLVATKVGSGGAVAWSPGSLTAAMLSFLLEPPTTADAATSPQVMVAGSGAKKGRWVPANSLPAAITGLPASTGGAGAAVLVSNGSAGWTETAVTDLVTPIPAPDAAGRLLFSVSSGSSDVLTWAETAVPQVLSAYIPVAGTSNTGQLLVSDGGNAKWTTSSFSSVSGIPTPNGDKTDSGKVLGVDGTTWALVDPGKATGLPVATGANQIIVAKKDSSDGSAYWSVVDANATSADNTVDYLVGGSDVSVFRRSFIATKGSGSEPTVIDPPADYDVTEPQSVVIDVYDGAVPVTFRNGVMHFAVSFLIDPSIPATDSMPYVTIGSNVAYTMTPLPKNDCRVRANFFLELPPNFEFTGQITVTVDKRTVCSVYNDWEFELFEGA